MGARLKFWRRSRVPEKGSRDEAVEIPPARKPSLRSWRYCVGARLKFWRRNRVPKKGSRDEAVEIPLVTAPPSNLTRLYYNSSATKSHSTTTQYRQLRRLIWLMVRSRVLI